MAKFYCMVCIFVLMGCGIDGVPLSPSEKKSSEQKKIFPFDNGQKQDNRSKEKKYLSISELEMIGSDYNANIGVENDELDDSFERVKPQSAFPKKRRIIPLGKN